MKLRQNKVGEIIFFTEHAEHREYNVFTDRSNERLINRCLELSGLHQPGWVADLGCGSGVFTAMMREKGFHCFGVDISHAMAALGRKLHPNVSFFQGDCEVLPISTGSLDGVLLSGVIHHLPDPALCAREVYRVLRPGGVFMAFDPNRLHPFTWLYRDHRSPFYSRKGVTENERPILANETNRVFAEVGFDVSTDYLHGLHYRYIASPILRWFLPFYNVLDFILFTPGFLKLFRAFVLTIGVKKTRQ